MTLRTWLDGNFLLLLRIEIDNRGFHTDSREAGLRTERLAYEVRESCEIAVWGIPRRMQM